MSRREQGIAYLEQKYGFRTIVIPETNPNKIILEKVYNQWRRLYDYWLISSSRCKTVIWIRDMDMLLFVYWHRGDLDDARRLFNPEALEKARRAVRRGHNHPPGHRQLPSEVVHEIIHLLWPEDSACPM